MQERVYVSQTHIPDTSDLKQRLIDSLIHEQAYSYHETSLTNQLVNGESGYVQA